MKLLDRFLMRQYFGTFIFMLGIMLSVSILVDFVEKVDTFVDKNPPLTEIVFDYYLNFIPFWGNMLTPVIIYLSVILFVSRMAQRSEIVPILSGGISYYRVLAPLFVASVLLAMASFGLKAYVIPYSTLQRVDFEYKYFGKRKISSNRHIHKKVAADTYVYISYYNEKQKVGHNFGLERVAHGDILVKMEAKKIIWVDSLQHWRLQGVRVREMAGRHERLRFYTTLDTTFLLTPDDIFIKEEKAATMTLPALRDYIRLEEMRGSDILTELYTELYRRYADPVAIIVLTLIGFAMSSKKTRGGVALQMGLGLLICFLYIALLLIGQVIVGEDVPTWVAVWLPNFIFSPVALFLLYIAPK